MVKLNDFHKPEHKVTLAQTVWYREEIQRVFKQTKDKHVLMDGTEFRINSDYITSRFGDHNENFFNFHIESYTTSTRTFFVLVVCGIEIMVKTKEELAAHLEVFFTHMDMLGEAIMFGILTKI